MEILFEIVAQVLMAILQFVGELLLQLGAAGGGASLLVAPELYIKIHWLRVANLVLTPVIAGLVMVGLGAWRRRREKQLIRLESFAYGFLFAFSMAAVRAYWGR